MTAKLRSSTRRPTHFDCDSGRRQRGFTMLELLVVIAIIIVVGAITLPSLQKYQRNYRIAGDARRIASQIALARMRSAGDFNQASVFLDTTATPNTYELEICSKAQTPIVFALDINDAKFQLSSGVSFGYGSITTPAGPYPPASPYQTTIAQTTAVVFNSRGIPVTYSGTYNGTAWTCGPGTVGTPTGTDAIYLSGAGNLYYAVTIGQGGKIDIWRYYSGAWNKAGY